MIWTAVYATPSTADGRAAAIHANVEAALAALTEIERHAVDGVDAASRRRAAAPGLVRIEDHRRVVALGLDAHVALADARKCSLIAGDIEVELRRTDDLAPLVWSCANTATVVALGAAAWRSVQLLPFDRRRFQPLPPLRLGAGEGGGARVLVIDHEDGAETARALAALLRRDVAEVAYLGARRVSSAGPAVPDPAWSGGADIHVHVGHHAAGCETLRLLDSWQSRCPALQLVPRDGRAGAHHLLIEDGVNGFLCHAPDAVRARLAELVTNRVRRRTLVAAGLRSAAPLAQGWAAVVQDLLS